MWIDDRVVIKTKPEILLEWNKLKNNLELKTSNNLILFLMAFYKENKKE
jgi:hypothetical protein